MVHRLSMNQGLRAAIAAIAAVFVAREASSQGPPPLPEVLSVRAAAPTATAKPGDQFPVAILLEIQKGWHIWPSQASLDATAAGGERFDDAIPTELTVSGWPTGAAVGRTQWPTVHFTTADIGSGPRDYPVYEGTAVAYIPVTLPSSWPADASKSVRLSITVAYQACNEDSCLPPAEVSTTVEVAIGEASIPSAASASLFSGFDPAGFATAADGSASGSAANAADGQLTFQFFGTSFSLGTHGASFVLLLIVAAFGGFLLNLTPCVLPVIPLKVMGLAATASNRAHAIFLAAVMSAGVIAFWLALATGLAFVQGFEQANQLFQFPAFTIGIGVFIAVMAIGMAGFFTVGLPSWIYSIETKNESAGGAFVFGILTAILSTPCTAPFMGSAAGWAVKTGSPSTIYAVFGAIGAGMAAPYLLLSLFPALVARVPRAGESSEVVKQVMGILLLAAAAYFIGAGVNQLLPKPTTIYWWVVAAIGASAGLWLLRQTIRIAKSTKNKVIFGGIGVAVTGVSVAVGAELGRGERIAWVPYSTEAAAEGAARGDVVVIDFTADWCINCKTLEKVVLESDAVSAELGASDVLPLKADIGRDDAAKDRLHAEGFVTIPLLVIVAPNGEVVMKASDYSPSQVVDAIEQARTKREPRASGTE